MSRKMLIEPSGGFASVPVSRNVQHAIERATTAAYDALLRELEPFGLTPFDIVIPDYEQVVYEDEAPIFAALVNKMGEPLADWERELLEGWGQMGRNA